MKITVKTTNQKVFSVEIEPAQTVGQLKERIQAEQGHPAASQKVIFSGKILNDATTI